MCVCLYIYIKYTYARDTEACHGVSQGKDLNAQLVFGVRLLFGYQLLVQFKNRHFFNERHFLRSGLDGSSHACTDRKIMLAPIFLILQCGGWCWNVRRGVLHYGFFFLTFYLWTRLQPKKKSIYKFTCGIGEQVCTALPYEAAQCMKKALKGLGIF